ncbi:uncharacterized protein PITG_00522 [Phytophthora infestans T30-4]|uniref:Uncharacterized protein n=1 Tax=Phytophthora infestans (strain T30-4) TaxID=403677 RepID=D0MR08_PHYIT|nr:uncharacterized protein PITG_00522 [Phytophthora infestans T30-4]EEY57927.1 conserved hypothetical protein [Phytophthora infestans T30-4]|eukprot:XP_002909113.1 conserved hypothetical protein [Phytophthora infestans T30-4]
MGHFQLLYHYNGGLEIDAWMGLFGANVYSTRKSTLEAATKKTLVASSIATDKAGYSQRGTNATQKSNTRSKSYMLRDGSTTPPSIWYNGYKTSFLWHRSIGIQALQSTRKMAPSPSSKMKMSITAIVVHLSIWCRSCQPTIVPVVDDGTSDEFNVANRSFRAGDDHIWTPLEKPDGVNGALELYSHNMTPTKIKVRITFFEDVVLKRTATELLAYISSGTLFYVKTDPTKEHTLSVVVRAYAEEASTATSAMKTSVATISEETQQRDCFERPFDKYSSKFVFENVFHSTKDVDDFIEMLPVKEI